MRSTTSAVLRNLPLVLEQRLHDRFHDVEQEVALGRDVVVQATHLDAHARGDVAKSRRPGNRACRTGPGRLSGSRPQCFPRRLYPAGGLPPRGMLSPHSGGEHEHVVTLVSPRRAVNYPEKQSLVCLFWPGIASVPDVLRRNHTRRPGAAAVVDQGRRLNHGQLAERAWSVANGLIHAGVKPGDTVAILCGNGIFSAETILGAIAAGAVAAPLSWRWSSAELEHGLNDSQRASRARRRRVRAAGQRARRERADAGRDPTDCRGRDL